MYEPFFDYARARQNALLKKRAGVPKGQQSDDPIINYYKFCNIFREDDRTTIWLRENVRVIGPHPHLLLATILFRWFNRIETGKAIWGENGALDSTSPWHTFIENIDGGNINRAFNLLRASIVAHSPRGPYVTGSYCIIGMPHMSKLDGVLACVRNVVEDNFWRETAQRMLDLPGQVMMQDTWEWFRRFPRSGDFMAYEIVTDLQHSPGFLDQAPDRMTWANAGPGAIRGLNRIHERYLEQQHPKEKTNEEMRDILQAALTYPEYWPSDWPSWDMRTVEHSLCEHDKYERLRLGQGTVKGVYR